MIQQSDQVIDEHPVGVLAVTGSASAVTAHVACDNTESSAKSIDLRSPRAMIKEHAVDEKDRDPVWVAFIDVKDFATVQNSFHEILPSATKPDCRFSTYHSEQT
jgi:hypothetical protein